MSHQVDGYKDVGHCSNLYVGSRNEDRYGNDVYGSNLEVGYDSEGVFSNSGDCEGGFSGGNSQGYY